MIYVNEQFLSYTTLRLVAEDNAAQPWWVRVLDAWHVLRGRAHGLTIVDGWR